MNDKKEIMQDRKEQFAEVVSMIQHTRNEVIRLANASLINLYWRVGKYISDKMSVSEWGDGVVKQLAEYIEKNSPETKGFSDKNLWRMKQFYELYNGADEKLSSLLRHISWTNNLTIMSRSKSPEERLFYLQLCVHDRLSTRQLNRQIDSALYDHRDGSTDHFSAKVLVNWKGVAIFKFADGKLHLGNIQINLVFHSICITFADDNQYATTAVLSRIPREALAESEDDQ